MAEGGKKVCAPRERKSNFTHNESALISSRATDQLEIVRGKHSNDLTNTQKQDFWKTLTEEVNALGVACRSEEEVKNRWRNMSRCTKVKFTKNRLERQKTGGGPSPAALTVAEERIVDAMQDTASFIGVPGGQESAVIQLDADNSSTRPSIEVEVNPRSWDAAIRNLTAQIPEQIFADDAEDSTAATPATSSASSAQGQKRCRIQDVVQVTTGKKKKTEKEKKTAEDVYTIQYAYFEREMVKSELQIQLLKKLLETVDAQQDAVSLLAALSH